MDINDYIEEKLWYEHLREKKDAKLNHLIDFGFSLEFQEKYV